jgi:hypothetical protein
MDIMIQTKLLTLQTNDVSLYCALKRLELQAKHQLHGHAPVPAARPSLFILFNCLEFSWAIRRAHNMQTLLRTRWRVKQGKGRKEEGTPGSCRGGLVGDDEARGVLSLSLLAERAAPALTMPLSPHLAPAELTLTRLQQDVEAGCPAKNGGRQAVVRFGWGGAVAQMWGGQ